MDEDTGQNKQSNDNNGAPPVKPPPEVPSPDKNGSDGAQPPAHQGANASERHDRIMRLFTGIIMGATVIYALAAAWTLLEIRHQTQQFAEGQRPWLWPESTQMGYDEGTKIFWVSPVIKNVGLSPGVNIISRGGIYTPPDATTKIDNFFAASTLSADKIENPQREVLAPGFPKGLRFEINATSPAQYNWAIGHDAYVFVALRIWYQDRFGNQYRTDYCGVWYASKKDWIDCQHHNEAE
jgi:hypothetical protein